MITNYINSDGEKDIDQKGVSPMDPDVLARYFDDAYAGLYRKGAKLDIGGRFRVYLMALTVAKKHGDFDGDPATEAKRLAAQPLLDLLDRM